MAAIPVAYAYYVKKIPSLRISAVARAMLGDKPYARALAKAVDYLMAVCTCGGICVTLGLGVPLVSNGLGKIFGFTPNFLIHVIVCIFVAGIYTLSSWVGLSKGMKLISTINMYMAIALVVVLLIFGPTRFIINNIVNSAGIMFNDLIRMSLWLDPIGGNTFPQEWTIFYWCFGWAFASLVAIFMTQISRGRQLREMIACLLFGGPAGCLLFFGIDGSFSMNMQITGRLDVAGIVAEQGSAEAVTSILQTAGFGVAGLIVFVLITWFFTATTLDSAAFSLSSAATPQLKEGENTSPILRLYWCIVLALLPMAMIFIKAPLSSLQNLVVILATPFVFIYFLMMIKTQKWMRDDCPKMIDGRLPEDIDGAEPPEREAIPPTERKRAAL
jgi:BCCT family betaine/carnitine transporter